MLSSVPCTVSANNSLAFPESHKTSASVGELRSLAQGPQDLDLRVADWTREQRDENKALLKTNSALEEFSDIVVGRGLKMIALEREVQRLQRQLQQYQANQTVR
jgi:hypothetical protein